MISFEKNTIREKIFSLFLILSIVFIALDRKFAVVLSIFLVLISIAVIIKRKVKVDKRCRFFILLFVIAMSLMPASVFWSIHNLHLFSWRELDNYSRFLVFIPVGLALCFSNVKDHHILMAFSSAAVILALRAIVDFDVVGQHRVLLDFRNPIPFGNVAMSISVVSLISAIIYSTNLKYRAIFFVAGIVGLYGAFLSGNKGGIISLIILGAISIYSYKAKINIKILLITMLVLSVWVINHFSSNFLSNQYSILVTNAQCFLEDPYSRCALGPVGARVWMIIAGVYIFINNINYGVSSSELKNNIQSLIESGRLPKDMPIYDHLHNEIINQLATYGLLGFMGYSVLVLGLILLAYSLRGNLQCVKYSFWKTQLLVQVVLFVEFGFSQSLLSHSSTATYFSFIFSVFSGLLLMSYRQAIEKNTSDRSNKRTKSC